MKLKINFESKQIQKLVTPNLTPSIVIRPSIQQKILKGGSIDIECIENTGVRMSLNWRRVDAKQLSPRINFLQTNQQSLLLRLKNAEKEDFGEYECVASNSMGTVSKSIRIIEGK
jgi:hypothetical protein